MDTEYVLSCAFELGETTPLENAVLWSPEGAYPLVRRLVDNDLAMPHDYLANTARDTFQRANQRAQHVFALRSLPSLTFGLKAFRERIQCDVQTVIQRNLGVDTRSGVLAPWGAATPVPQYGIQEADVSEALVRQVLQDVHSSLWNRWSEDFDALNRSARWLAQQGPNGLDALGVGNSPQGAHAEGLLTQLRQEQQARLKQERQKRQKLAAQARSAIKKATKLFENLGQRDNLTLFVSGHEVALSHPDSLFKFVLKPSGGPGWLVDRTQTGRSHTPYEVALFTKDDVYLAKLCVYFNNTPVLDQLLAMTLFVNSGDEMKVLETANWFSLGDWPADVRSRIVTAHPQLKQKLPHVLDSQRAQQPHAVVIAPHVARLSVHWEQYQGRVEQWVRTWLEPLQAQAMALSQEAALVQAALEPPQSLALAA